MTKSHDVHSLSHTKWNCKYHIFFAPKYRRKVFFGQKRYEIGQILRELCRWKGVNLLEAEACPDHIHILVEIPPKMSVSSFMGFLKGKSSLMIYEKWGNMKFLFYPIRALMSSSTLPMPPMPKFSTSTLATLGDRKAGRVGPRWMFFTPRCSKANRTITAFCSYQEIL